MSGQYSLKYPLGIIAPNIGVRSETFIRRHMLDLLPGGTAVVARATFPQPVTVDWKPSGPVLDMSKVRSSQLRWQLIRATAQKLGLQPDRLKVKNFLRSYGVNVVMGEYLDLSLQWFEVAQQLGIPFFAHAHGIDVSVRLREPKWRAEYLRYNDAAGVITMSHAAREDLIGIGISPSRIQTVHYGIDVPAEATAREDRKEIRCLSVGRMIPCKSPILVLDSFRRALQQCPTLRLDYVGNGELFPAATHFVQALGLGDRVVLHGSQPSQIVADLMRKADVYFQHSITDPTTGHAEGLPVAILEAMAQGLPVVTSRIGGTPEEVVDSITGYLVEPGDTVAMGERIATLARDPDLRRRLGLAGWWRAKQHFSWEKERSELLGILGLNRSPLALAGADHLN